MGPHLPKFVSRTLSPSKITVRRGTVGLVNVDSRQLHLVCDDGVQREVSLAASDAHILSLVARGFPIAVIFPDNSAEKPRIILAPDRLYDVTEIVECMFATGDEPIVGVVKRFEPRITSVAMIKGTLLNAVFDTIVADKTISNSEIIDRVLRLRPLALAAIMSTEGEKNYQAMIDEIQNGIERFREVVEKFGAENISVEPQLMSNVYGMQGRFDILIQEPNGTRLIEMKSGKAPSLSKTENGGLHSNSIRTNHAAQVSAYAMLFDAIDPDARRSAEVWYAIASVREFRDVPNLGQMMQRVVQQRNMLVIYDSQISNRDFSCLKISDTLRYNHIGYGAEFVRHFAETYNLASPICRTVFQLWTNFISTARQRLFSLQSDLWSGSVQQKRESKQSITDLTVVESESEFTHMHITLRRNDEIGLSQIRVGDHIILHAELADGTANLGAGQVLKGAVTSIKSNSLVVSLRNKHLSKTDLLNATWMVEQDVSDSGLKQLYASAFTFLQAPQNVQEKIIGVTAPGLPSKATEDRVTDPILTPTQHAIINNAVNCSDYYLIQGPPGTGKTQIILKNIVEQILTSSTERLLVLTYTNRAANEICLALEGASQDVQFLRHGSKFGASGGRGEYAIPQLAQQLSCSDLETRIRTSNCIVGTVQSVLSSAEIWDFGKFTTLIIDEASQVLEPHLAGILPRVNRWIMIGDECQLPAVVTQEDTEITINSPALQALGYVSTATSYFERMRALCTTKCWQHATATLTEQARMHDEIMNVASACFYSGSLTSLSAWQSNSSPTPWTALLPYRACFIDVSTMPDLQQQAEAECIVGLLKKLWATDPTIFTLKSVGVITPFRSQNNSIKAMLPDVIAETVTIDTVERFQGSQRDIIVFGAAVGGLLEFNTIRSEATSNGTIIDRKLNVAMTRAREQFVLVGSAEVLDNSEVYKRVLNMLGKQNLTI